MKQFTLQRDCNTPHGMFGVLSLQGVPLFQTIECPWRNNASNISCIPPGTYEVQLTYSPAFKRELYLVTKVPSRSGIRFHMGNVAGMKDKGFITDFHGCIGLGESRGTVFQQRGILGSARAMRKFQDITCGQPFILTIRGEFKPYV